MGDEFTMGARVLPQVQVRYVMKYQNANCINLFFKWFQFNFYNQQNLMFKKCLTLKILMKRLCLDCETGL